MAKRITHIVGKETTLTLALAAHLENGEGIELLSWTVDHGDIVASSSHDYTSATIMLKSGEPKHEYALEIDIKTTANREIKVKYWVAAIRDTANETPPPLEIDPEIVSA